MRSHAPEQAPVRVVPEAVAAHADEVAGQDVVTLVDTGPAEPEGMVASMAHSDRRFLLGVEVVRWGRLGIEEPSVLTPPALPRVPPC